MHLTVQKQDLSYIKKKKRRRRRRRIITIFAESSIELIFPSARIQRFIRTYESRLEMYFIN